jgi:hypothetical protein
MDLPIQMLSMPRARRSDPSTSHDAANRATAFAGSHRDRIYYALGVCSTAYEQGQRDHWGATAHQLSAITGLTVVQIDRRLPELERDDLVTVCGDEHGRDLTHEGFRMWERIK